MQLVLLTKFVTQISTYPSSAHVRALSDFFFFFAYFLVISRRISLVSAD
jgi:hypothetical protein